MYDVYGMIVYLILIYCRLEGPFIQQDLALLAFSG